MTPEERKHFAMGILSSFLAGMIVWLIQSQVRVTQITEEEEE